MSIRTILTLIIYLQVSNFAYSQELVELKDGWLLASGGLYSPLDFPESAGSGHIPELSRNNNLPTLSPLETWRIRLDLAPEISQWGLMVPEIFSSYRLFINGKMAGEVGRPSTSLALYIPVTKKRTYFFYSSGETEILLQVANWSVHGEKIRAPLVLGPAIAIHNKETFEFGLEIFLTTILILSGLSLMIWPEVFQRKSSLLLGVTLVLLGIRMGFTGYKVIPGIWNFTDFEIISDIGYLMAPLIGIVFLYALFLRFKTVMDEPLVFFILFLNIVSGVPILLTKTLDFEPFACLYESALSLAIVAILLIPLGLWLNKARFQFSFWFSLLAVPITGFVDLMIGAGWVRSPSFLPFGLLIFTCGQVINSAVSNMHTENEENRLLAHLQKLEKKRSNFLDQLHHHIRTPVHGVFGALEKIPEGDNARPDADRAVTTLRNMMNEVNKAISQR